MATRFAISSAKMVKFSAVNCRNVSKPPTILTNEQVRQALAFTRQEHPRFLAWLALAVFAGVRPEELDQVTWDDVRWDSRTLVIDAAASKVRRRRIVHLEQAPVDWLTLARKLKADLPVPSVSRRRWLRAMRDHLGFKAWPQDALSRCLTIRPAWVRRLPAAKTRFSSKPGNLPLTVSPRLAS